MSENEVAFQELLPAGICLKGHVEEPWDAPGAERDRCIWVYRAEDVRAGMAIERKVCFVRVERAEWKTKLQERLAFLMRWPMPHVLRPLEVGLDEEQTMAWIVMEREACPLSQSEYLLGDGLPEEEVIQIVRQMLAGLQAFHREGISHGDLRPANIVLDPADDRKQVAWMAGAELGPLAWWTQGCVVHSESAWYYPPDWNQKVGQPSPRADLYAVGLIACQALLGKEGSPQTFSPMQRANDLREPIRQRLQEHGRGVSTVTDRVIIEQFLDPDPQRRPATADDAIEAFERPCRMAWRLTAVCLAAVLLIFASGMWWSASRLSRRVITRFDGLSPAIRDSVKDMGAELTTRLGSMADDLKRISDRLPPPPDPPPAQDRWGQLHAWGFVARGDFDGLGKRIMELAKPEETEQLNSWLKSIRGRYEQANVWRGRDTRLEECFRLAVEEPWNADRSTEFDRRLSALQVASKKWRTWANDLSLSGEQLLLNVLASSADEREVLQQWLEELKQFSPKLRLTAARSSEGGWGTTRQVGVWTDSQGHRYGPVHEWRTDKQHDYRTDLLPTRDIPLTWKQGDSVCIYLYGQRRIWDIGANRPNLIVRSFSGPLALWRAADAGQVVQQPFTLGYEIVGKLGFNQDVACPGPPPSNSAALARGVANIMQPGK